MKSGILKNITDKADELSRQYEKTKDPGIREQWFKLIRSVSLSSDDMKNEDTILRPPQSLSKKSFRQIK